MRNFNLFNKDKFLNDLKQKEWSKIALYSDPNEMWDLWKQLLMSSIDKHAPVKHKRIGKKKSPWITSDLLQKMHKRDYLKKKAVQTNDQNYWRQYKVARNETNNAIKKQKREYFTTNLDTNKNNPCKTWKLTNKLNSQQHKSANIAEMKIGNQSVSSSEDIAEILNSHFTSVGQALANEIPSTDVKPEIYLQQTPKTFTFQAVTVDNVRDLLLKTNSKKATGLDKIPCKVLKLAANIIAPSLMHIFNQSIAICIFPTEWKLARVSPIYKKGKKDDPNNFYYRPISVIPVVAKIFEKLVHEQLYSYLNDNDLLANYQSGFRSLHSTLTALLEATENWSLNIDNGQINGVIFIDLKKVFDTIDHNIIIRKLSSYGVDQKALRWFQSYLSDRSQKCSVNSHLSTVSPITCGVPQGSITGPLLFLVYINDLPNCLEKASPQMYADDTSTSLAAVNVSDLENEINRELINLNRWLKANKLSLNIAKTEFMIIGSCQRIQKNCCNHQLFNIQLESKNIENVDHTKSLGIFIDKNLSWKKTYYRNIKENSICNWRPKTN